jgi:hypothetical protein
LRQAVGAGGVDRLGWPLIPLWRDAVVVIGVDRPVPGVNLLDNFVARRCILSLPRFGHCPFRGSVLGGFQAAEITLYDSFIDLERIGDLALAKVLLLQLEHFLPQLGLARLGFLLARDVVLDWGSLGGGVLEQVRLAGGKV